MAKLKTFTKKNLKKYSNKFGYIISLAVLVVIGLLTYTYQARPADINKIVSLPNGCYYEQSKCNKRGDDCIEKSVLVCPSPAASIAIGCTMDAFVCADGTTVGRTGSQCEFVCPSSAPTSTPVSSLKPGCRMEYPPCIQPICSPDGVCPVVKCEPIMVCASTSPTILPTSVPTETSDLVFNAYQPCGESSYLNITYRCQNSNIKKQLSNGVCTNISTAFNQVKAACGPTKEAR